MTAQTQSRSLSITINSTDYSAYLLDFSIGFESWQSGSGIVKKSGEISLTAIAGGVSLDPRDNGDFFPGAAVTVNWNGAAHPLGGSLLVLSPPTVEPILSDLPVTASNIALKIPVGCALNYYDTDEPDDDESGVTFGTPIVSGTVVKNLLLAAGIPEPVGTWTIGGKYNIDFPVQKTNGSFIDLAGALMYATYPETASLGGAGYLYCNDENIVRWSWVRLASSSTLDLELGVEDKDYVPLLDASLPPGTVNMAGIKRTVESRQGCTTTVFEEGDSRVTYTQCFYSPGYADTVPTYNPSYGEIAFTVTLGGQSKLPSGTGPAYTFTYGGTAANYGTWSQSTKLDNGVNVSKLTVLKESKSPSGNFGTGGIWYSTGTETTWKVFNDDGLLVAEINKKDLPLSLLSSLSTSGTVTQAGGSITEYSYGQSGVIKSRKTRTYACKVAIAPDIFTGSETDLYDVILTKQEQYNWTQDKDFWTEQITISQSRITEFPDFVEDLTNPSSLIRSLRYFDLIESADSTTIRSNTGETVPPASPEIWTGLYSITESQMEQSAVFTKSAKQVDLTTQFAFDDNQLKSIAETEGEIIWGRSYQYLIECDPTIFASQTSPMPIIRVFGAGENRIFLADAIQWFHTATEDYVGFAGVYLGASGGDSGTGGNQSRINTISPIVLGNVEEINIDFVGYGVEYSTTVTANEVV